MRLAMGGIVVVGFLAGVGIPAAEGQEEETAIVARAVAEVSGMS